MTTNFISFPQFVSLYKSCAKYFPFFSEKSQLSRTKLKTIIPISIESVLVQKLKHGVNYLRICMYPVFG